MAWVRIAGRTEEEMYEALGLPWIPPELRENRGEIAASDKPLLFTMARLDRIKNMSGLVELFGRSDDLRDAATIEIVSAQ